jgi:hypothetical protein
LTRSRATAGYLALAEIFTGAGAYAKALEALDKAEAVLGPGLRSSPENLRLRALKARTETARGFTLVLAGQAAGAANPAREAVAIAEEIARVDPSYDCDLARALALQAGLAPSEFDPPTAALRALRRAVDAGFDNPHKLETDAILAPLRSRPEFQALIRRLKNDPVTPTGPADAREPGPRVSDQVQPLAPRGECGPCITDEESDQ